MQVTGKKESQVTEKILVKHKQDNNTVLFKKQTRLTYPLHDLLRRAAC